MMDEWKQSRMTGVEYTIWVTRHMSHHMNKGDLFEPSDDNCELFFCTCSVGQEYRARLGELRCV